MNVYICSVGLYIFVRLLLVNRVSKICQQMIPVFELLFCTPLLAIHIIIIIIIIVQQQQKNRHHPAVVSSRVTSTVDTSGSRRAGKNVGFFFGKSFYRLLRFLKVLRFKLFKGFCILSVQIRPSTKFRPRKNII